MNIILGTLAGIFAIGMLGEKDKTSQKHRTICFCVTVAAIVIINIF